MKDLGSWVYREVSKRAHQRATPSMVNGVFYEEHMVSENRAKFHVF